MPQSLRSAAVAMLRAQAGRSAAAALVVGCQPISLDQPVHAGDQPRPLRFGDEAVAAIVLALRQQCLTHSRHRVGDAAMPSCSTPRR